jgi:hypothetical protein
MPLLSQVMHQNGYRHSYEKHIKKNYWLSIVSRPEWVTDKRTCWQNIRLGPEIKGII